jgi:hypothetical protein
MGLFSIILAKPGARHAGINRQAIFSLSASYRYNYFFQQSLSDD